MHAPFIGLGEGLQRFAFFLSYVAILISQQIRINVNLSENKCQPKTVSKNND